MARRANADFLQWVLAPQPDWAKDAVIVDVDIVLDWRDIALLLWRRGRMGVSVKTWTEAGPIGRAESMTHVLIPRVRWPWQKPFLGVTDA